MMYGWEILEEQYTAKHTKLSQSMILGFGILGNNIKK